MLRVTPIALRAAKQFRVLRVSDRRFVRIRGKAIPQCDGEVHSLGRSQLREIEERVCHACNVVAIRSRRNVMFRWMANGQGFCCAEAILALGRVNLPRQQQTLVRCHRTRKPTTRR